MANDSGDNATTFSDYFDVSKDILDEEGLFDISLISDLPLFIDPFLLFYSENEEYQRLHDEIIKYLAFLRDESVARGESAPSRGKINSYYRFPEVKQNWFGFSFVGNSGRGLGLKFARTLDSNFHELFSDEEGGEVHHLEKLTLVAPGVGKDTISDFTTNLIHGYLAKRTEDFAKKYIDASKTQTFTIRKAEFDYDRKVWVPKRYTLPEYKGDYILLTPKEILTRHDTWINKTDLIDDFHEIPPAVSNEELREQLSAYFKKKLQEYAEKKVDRRTNKVVSKVTKRTRAQAAWDTIHAFPEALDTYIRLKEENGEEAISLSEELVTETDQVLHNQFADFVQKTGYQTGKPTSIEEARARAIYFKECIEQREGYKNLYVGEEPVDEDWVQRMFWFVWYGAASDVNREPNNGGGEPDYAVSQGSADKTLVEFKLARNRKLEQNLLKQLEHYKKIEKTSNGVWVIIFFTAEEEEKVRSILEKHNLLGYEDYILVDARKDNKISASRRK